MESTIKHIGHETYVKGCDTNPHSKYNVLNPNRYTIILVLGNVRKVDIKKCRIEYKVKKFKVN